MSDCNIEENNEEDLEFDDELALPDPIGIIDVGDGPVAIVQSEEECDPDSSSKRLSYNSIHKRPIKFDSNWRNIFIPGADIHVTITDCERSLTTHLLNPNLYCISLHHGDFIWQIKKRYKDIQKLHQHLIIFRTSLNIPFPSKTHKNKRRDFKETEGKSRKQITLPRFPKKPELLITYEKLDARKKQLESYLNNLLSIRIYRNNPATIDFLEISQLSFVHGLGSKRKEGMLDKRNGSTRHGQPGCGWCGLFRAACCIRWQHLRSDILCTRWAQRWFFVKDTYFGYINPKDGRLASVILFDQGFEVSSGMYSMGLEKGFQVITLSRQIALKCWTKRKAKEWIASIKDVAGSTARDFILPNKHNSFVPMRCNILASWFVDGETYMSAVADAIDAAKEEIFIADWWLSPEIYLKRPHLYGHTWRLDVLLKQKAEEGVKIFILLYKELELALGLNSYYSKQRLAHENIKVLRHPDHAKVGVFFWAHHEKILVVDQNCAFIGGIDLCYGRWDNASHRLTDLGSITTTETFKLEIKDCITPTEEGLYPTATQAHDQKPIHPSDEEEEDLKIAALQVGDNLLVPDIPERMKCNTPEVERKTVLKKLKTVIKGKNLLSLVYSQNERENPAIQINCDDENENLIDTLSGSSKLWIGKDYVNFIIRDFNNLEQPFDDFIDRTTTPRMPWHDVGVCVQGATARDIARHFIQRWNATKLEKAKCNDAYPYLLPKNYEDFKSLPKKITNGARQVTCQVLRSVSTWSSGFLEPDTVEQSIHEAYLECITKAQHYIYIENQFFISLQYGNPNTKNRIGDELYKRILRAHRAKEMFRVFVVMPLLPGFEGEVGETNGISLHAITHWNYSSISCGKDALLNRLIKAGITDPSNYISFYGLRNHATLNNEPITELIYVHSKLMIIDDKIVICGSANINDRSLIGKRDSEIAVLIEDEQFDDGIMNGKKFPSGKFAGSLRKYLFKEHLGLLGNDEQTQDTDITDPVSNYFYKEVWFKTASSNTELYETLFNCIPSDKVQSFSELREYKLQKPLHTKEPVRAKKMLENIQGHLVLLPLKFLSNELLTPGINTMEGMMPTSLWT